MSNQLEYFFSLIKERKAEIQTLFIGIVLLLVWIFIADVFLTKYISNQNARSVIN